MNGCRHSGIRIIFPPTNVCTPLRITCKLLDAKNVSVLPEVEGDGLATRIIKLGPPGAFFSGYVLLP